MHQESSNTKKRHEQFLKANRDALKYQSHFSVNRKEVIDDMEISRIIDQCVERNYAMELCDWDDDSIQQMIGQRGLNEEDPDPYAALTFEDYDRMVYESLKQDEFEEETMLSNYFNN